MRLNKWWNFPIALSFVTVLLQHPSILVSGARRNCNTIQAAFTFSQDDGHGVPYFLSGGEYIEYNLYRQSEAEVGPIRELGLDARVSDADAVFTLSGGSVVAIKDCRYFKYVPHNNRNRLRLQQEGSNFGGLPCSPDAAVGWNGNILVFKGCNVWKLSNTSQTFHADGDLTERGLPCDLDAAVEWESSQVIFIKGTQFWKFDYEMTGPFHTDELNLCSWYLCGEADWMRDRNRGRLRCNGDRRLCPLRLDQVTLPGLHNAGAGFHYSFGLFNCWARNHGRSILEQLQLGIRYLDIDSSYDMCGVVGTHHNMFCGGSVCRMLKQVRAFLGENPHEVVALTFNHEMEDADKVIPKLTRQLKNQLRPLLNNRFRKSGQQIWPTLRSAVRTNKRLFVFYPPVVTNQPFARRQYSRNLWIHTENWVGSTWRPFTVGSDGNCDGIVSLTAERCEVRQYRELVEVSIVPTANLGTCVSTLADQCKHFLHDALRACQPYRHRHNRSPNVLLVDYPEVDAESTDSVFQAVYHQNIRNIYRHRRGRCQVRVDAAVRHPLIDDQVLFFVGSNLITYDNSSGAQINKRALPGVPGVDSAYISEYGEVVVTRGCTSVTLDSSSLLPLTSTWTEVPSCDLAFNATEFSNNALNIYQGCHMTPQGRTPLNVSTLGLPCEVDAALTFNRKTYVFKGNSYWVREEGVELFFPGGSTLDWTIDAVVC